MTVFWESMQKVRWQKRLKGTALLTLSENHYLPCLWSNSQRLGIMAEPLRQPASRQNLPTLSVKSTDQCSAGLPITTTSHRPEITALSNSCTKLYNSCSRSSTCSKRETLASWLGFTLAWSFWVYQLFKADTSEPDQQEVHHSGYLEHLGKK